VGLLLLYFPVHSGPLNLDILPSVGAMSTGDGFGPSVPLGKKRRVLRSSRPCYYQDCWCQHCWHTGLSYASL